MKFYYFLLFILLFAISCQNEVAPLPSDKMANILSDLHMAEAYAQLVPKDNGGYMSKNIDTLKILYGHIYKKHDMDTSTFNQALGWYKKHPLEFDKVYENVLEVLSIRKEIAKDSISETSDSTKVTFKDTL